MTSYHPQSLIKWHYPERLVSSRYKYKQLIKITNPSQRGKMSSHVLVIKEHLLIITVGKQQRVMGEKNR